MTRAKEQHENRIVVGVDGSECSERALEFATAEACRWGALLHVVSAYEVPPATGWVVVPLGPFAEGAAAVLSQALDKVRELAPHIVTKGEIHHGDAARMLIEASHGASLLVVGSRGRGEIASIFLGSVSERCGHHVNCPITIVH